MDLSQTHNTTEGKRLRESNARGAHWNRWGPYLSERAWGTVREDYSSDGTAWEDFPHDHARSRAYRWNEDGLAGICDRHQQICFAIALWNGRDPILKERLFGLTNSEGNHGEDVTACVVWIKQCVRTLNWGKTTMERAMMQGKTRTIGLLGTLGLILLLDGCAAMQREEAQSTEDLLAAAGFKMQLADTLKKRDHLKMR
jgi:hypothetical protein